MASIHVRTGDVLKKRVQKVLRGMGLDVSGVVNMCFQYIVLNERLPFTPSAHPEEVVKPLSPKLEKKWMEWEEAALREGKFYTSAEEMHRDILGDNYAS